MINTGDFTQGDMHFHTTRSDGYQSEDERLEKAQELGLQIVTATDHDVMSSKYFVQTALDNGIWSCPSTEISARNYEEGKSLHLTYYTNIYNKELNEILDHTRESKVEMIRLQLEKLLEYGFHGSANNFYRFHDAYGRGLGTLNKYDIASYIVTNPKNLQIIAELLKKFNVETMLAEDFLKIFLKEYSDHKELFYAEVEDYEPGVDVIGEIGEQNRTILAIAHPNFTFAAEGVEGFVRDFPYYYDRGVNAIEINSFASVEWIKTIYDLQSKFELLLTLGSDNHNQGSVDAMHADFGTINKDVHETKRPQIFSGVIGYLEGE